MGRGTSPVYAEVLLEAFRHLSGRVAASLASQPETAARVQLSLWNIAVRMELLPGGGEALPSEVELQALRALASDPSDPFLRLLSIWAIFSRSPEPDRSDAKRLFAALRETKLHRLESQFRTHLGNPLVMGQVNLSAEEQQVHVATVLRRLQPLCSAVPQLSEPAKSLTYLVSNNVDRVLEDILYRRVAPEGGTLHSHLLSLAEGKAKERPSNAPPKRHQNLVHPRSSRR